MLNDDQYDEFRKRIIERYDVYDLVEELELTVEDWLDNTSGWEDNDFLLLNCGLITEEEYIERTSNDQV